MKFHLSVSIAPMQLQPSIADYLLLKDQDEMTKNNRRKDLMLGTEAENSHLYIQEIEYGLQISKQKEQ